MNQVKEIFNWLLVLVILFLPLAGYAEEDFESGYFYDFSPVLNQPQIKIYDSLTFELENEFNLQAEEAENFQLSLAVLDLGGDGIKEIVIGASPGQEPLVKILRNDGSLINQFHAYDPGFMGGVHVGGGDINSDGRDEIVTGVVSGGGPHVRIFNGFGDPLFHPGFFAFDVESRAGVRPVVADLEGDGIKEIFVSQAGQAEVRVLDYRGGQKLAFEPFKDPSSADFDFAVFDADLDGQREILAAPGFGLQPNIKAFDLEANFEREFPAYIHSFRGGVDIKAVDLDNDNLKEIITAAGYGGGPHVRILSSAGRPKISRSGFMAFDPKFKGGIKIETGDVDGDSRTEIIVGTWFVPEYNADHFKFIEVDVSKQKLYAYQAGNKVKEMWVSTGTWRNPTTLGKFKISSKIESGRMSWYYGPDHPDNYDLANVPHIMPFNGPYTIHGAYWHYNFGHRMSHGCVNLSLSDAAELFGWAEIGTTVYVHE